MNPYSQMRPTYYDHTTYQMMSQLVAYGPLMLFVEEVIDYSMRQNNIVNWIPPMNMEYLRLQNVYKRYFDCRIGEAITHSCTERYAVNSALRHGFDEKSWLTLNPVVARERLVRYLELILMHAQVPMDLAAFQMFSFGCYVGRAAMKCQKPRWANEVAQALVRLCCIHFPYEKQYLEYLSKAETYNLEHRRMGC